MRLYLLPRRIVVSTFFGAFLLAGGGERAWICRAAPVLSESAESGGTVNLDQQLLEEPPTTTPPAPVIGQGGPLPDPSRPLAPGDLTRPPLTPLPPVPPDQNPLLPIMRKMEAAEQLVSREQSDTATQKIQADILKQIDALINNCRQCQNCQSPGGSAGSPSASRQPSQPRPGKNPAGGSAGEAPAFSGSEKLVDRNAKSPPAPAAQSPRDLLQSSWGQLPERWRAEMLEGPGDEFLPHFEPQLREYFRKLMQNPAAPR
ncbi:MAG: hypothetical protein SFX18_11555 [Pirellulales bacterium]|nr:hypothetical protein [Pirellulales bacterium]